MCFGPLYNNRATTQNAPPKKKKIRNKSCISEQSKVVQVRKCRLGPKLPVRLWRNGLTQEVAAFCIFAAKTRCRCFPIQFIALAGYCCACTRPFAISAVCYVRAALGHGRSIAASECDDSSNWAKALQHLCMVFVFFTVPPHFKHKRSLYTTSSAILVCVYSTVFMTNCTLKLMTQYLCLPNPLAGFCQCSLRVPALDCAHKVTEVAQYVILTNVTSCLHKLVSPCNSTTTGAECVRSISKHNLCKRVRSQPICRITELPSTPQLRSYN